MKIGSTAVIVALLSSLTIGTQAVEASPARTASGSRGNGSSYEVWRMNRDRNNDIFELRVWRHVQRQTSPPTCTYTFVSRSDALAFWDRIADQTGCPNQGSVAAQSPSTQTTQTTQAQQQPRRPVPPRRTITTTITTIPGETNRQPTQPSPQPTPAATTPPPVQTPPAATTPTITAPQPEPTTITVSRPAPASTTPGASQPTATTATTTPQPRPSADMAGQILSLVNAERQRAGVAPLTLNGQLTTAAQRHGRDMANNNHYSHTGTDGSSPGQRITAAGYSASHWGENIAWGQASAAEVMRAWMNSPGHRQNILNPNYTELGASLVVSESGRPYWVQKFGRPR